MRLTTCGGVETCVESYQYTISLLDERGTSYSVKAYGIEKITNDITSVGVESIAHLFKDVSTFDLQRPAGSVDLLIGLEYAAWHPRRVQSSGHLLLLKNQFGICIGGSHELLSENARKNILQVSVNVISIDKFFSLESWGTQCSPQCGKCGCGKCPIGGKNYTTKEEREIALIEKNIKFCGNYWEAVYPFH